MDNGKFSICTLRSGCLTELKRKIPRLGIFIVFGAFLNLFHCTHNAPQLSFAKSVWQRSVVKKSNLLKNSGFETTFGKGTMPTGWYAKSTGVPENPDTFYCGSAWTGQHSARLRSPSDSGTVFFQTADYLCITEEERYCLMGGSKTKDVNGFAQTNVIFTDSLKRTIGGFHGKAVSGSTEWEEFYTDGLAPKQARFALVYCTLEGNGQSWFDDLYFGKYINVKHPALASTGNVSILVWLLFITLALLFFGCWVWKFRKRLGRA